MISVPDLFAHKSAVAIGAAFGIVAGVAIALTIVVVEGPHSDRVRSIPRIPQPAIHTFLERGTAEQLVMVVIGSSACGASRGSRLAASLLAIRDTLRAIAQRQSVSFVSIGVAVDEDPTVGLDWLNTFGWLDELSAGDDWLNTAAVSYVWRQRESVGATPQVMIAIRSIREESRDHLVVSPSEPIVRMIGPADILTEVGLTSVDTLLQRELSHASSSSRALGDVKRYTK